jgi:predicted MFS family arabinose efflux permease
MVGIGGQYLGGRLTERIEPDRGMLLMLVCLTTFALLFVPAAETGLWGLLLVSFLLGFALFAMQPLSQATIAKYSLAGSRGLSFGYTYLAIFGVGALGAAIIGTVRTYGSMSTVFLALAAFSTLAGTFAVLLVMRD